MPCERNGLTYTRRAQIETPLTFPGDGRHIRKAFETALKSAPRRTRSLLGRARAESASGDTTAAAATYKELMEIWHNADADLPELAEAKGFVAVHH